MALMRTPSAIPATARRRDVRGAYACPFGHAVLFIIVGIQRSDNDDAQAEDDNEYETAIDVLSSFCPPRVAGPPFASTPNVEGTPPDSAAQTQARVSPHLDATGSAQVGCPATAGMSRLPLAASGHDPSSRDSAGPWNQFGP